MVVRERGSSMVTLLFTDLVASTELLARLGDDAAEEVRRTHFSLLRQAVAESGGEEVKTLGDGLMVVFSSAVDALSCAVAMQRRIEDQNAAGAGPRLSVRIGLHAGEPLRDGDDFHGEAVVVASRLCNEAEGGRVLTSQLVAGLVGSRGGFRFRPAGRLRLKGLPEPVAAVTVDWRPLADAPTRRTEKREPRSARGPATPRGPRLVGRDRELAALDADLARAVAGEFRCALLLGDGGVGKTRLAGELASRHAAGVISLSARAYPLGATTAFGVWTEALERHLRGLDPAEVERLCAGCLDDLAGLLRSARAVLGLAARPGEDPPRSRLLEAFTVVLSNLAADRPVVVLLDDVHLADASSLELLHYLAYGCADSRLLIVATARPTELAEHPETADVLARLEQDGLLRRSTLESLGPEALGGLVEAVTGERAPPVLVEWLEQRSQGNPLYAIGLLNALVEEGADLAAPALRRLPESLTERVAGRLRALDDVARRTLELLAVLGRQVDSRSLVGLSGENPDELTDILERLVHARAVVEEERGLELTYEIGHPLVAETIYQGISVGRRRRLHREVGRGLLAAGRLGEAAPHFVRSADPGDDEAVGVLRDAVRQAEQAESYREALTILGSLVELLPAGDPRWVDVVDALSWDAQWVIYHRADGHALFGIPALRAMDRALEGLGEPARQAPVKLRLANFLTFGSGDVEEAHAVCREAQRLFEEAGDRRGALLARHELAWIECHRGDMAAMELTAREIAREAAEIGDRMVRDRAMRTVALAATIRCRFTESDAALSEVIGNARADADQLHLFYGLTYAGWSLTMQGRGDEAQVAFGEAHAVSVTVGDERTPQVEVFNRWFAGDYRAALARAGEIGGLVGGALSPQGAQLASTAALVFTETGELGEARRYLAHSRAVYGERHWGFQSEVSRHAETVLAWREGRPGEAVGRLRGAVTRMMAMEAWAMAIPALVDLAEVGGRLGEADPTAVDGLTAIAECTGLGCHRALAELASAWASFAAGDRRSATTRAGRAADGLSELSWPIYLGRARCLLGQVTDDRVQAVEALRSAADIFDTCGATWRRSEALDALSRLGSAGKRAAAAATGPESLTSRERAVAGLAAAGLSAKEIGERLFIGKRTVEGHLARAYAKLGVGSKVELARRAAELDLRPEP